MAHLCQRPEVLQFRQGYEGHRGGFQSGHAGGGVRSLPLSSKQVADKKRQELEAGWKV